jgi:hypothetical protein
MKKTGEGAPASKIEIISFFQVLIYLDGRAIGAGA